MLIAENPNLIFVHIQRTGGSSIRRVLEQHIPSVQSRYGSHDFALTAKHILGEQWDDYFKFAFVRNPWERILSWYQMIVQTRQGQIAQWYRDDVLDNATQNKLWAYVFDNSTNFETFLHNCTQPIEDIDGVKSFAFNQLDYVTDETGRVIVDFIDRYENYPQDVYHVCDHLGLQVGKLPHLWPSNADHYSTYYTEATRQLVAERFARDIAFFGYTFEAVETISHV